jgi:hypothetical protein
LASLLCPSSSWIQYIICFKFAVQIQVIIMPRNTRSTETCYRYYKTGSIHNIRGFPKHLFLLVDTLKSFLECYQCFLSSFFCIVLEIFIYESYHNLISFMVKKRTAFNVLRVWQHAAHLSHWNSPELKVTKTDHDDIKCIQKKTLLAAHVQLKGCTPFNASLCLLHFSLAIWSGVTPNANTNNY